ncbi:MAG: hypothetical protein ABJB85_09980, partial [Nitrososphaerota archaeon]
GLMISHSFKILALIASGDQESNYRLFRMVKRGNLSSSDRQIIILFSRSSPLLSNKLFGTILYVSSHLVYFC